ncbi:ABC transporter ATP-binding protein [Acetobacter sp.]|jgi:iron complex transport system ATP-binding protein|uniref:ABC transporter ATP-binding protein n=1 Tax=Acetobacter sp. TaxID=440 RepID=UPI0025BB6DE1|nr:ABC transporter ATP-binding protein [Acetobacter sp.]MCH4092485.1 ABC transporter ATP-binding protein [Acetobacter sp.]MCI1299619.1 ABC transporter ATP-binding protein [Acetobacter sp.]MCI1315501.1 ABC transporter ATP-binding protein [Acetobacter sp.]
MTLEAQHLTCRRDHRLVLDAVSFTIGDGVLACLLGPNGAGKTTLLRAILRLEKVAGKVLLDGEDLSILSPRETARRIAYVPQTHSVAFAYTVEDMVAMGRLSHARLGLFPGRDDQEAVSEALNLMNITHLADRTYTQLSGGEQQAVLIARALAQGGRTLLLDEPASALDFGQQKRLWTRLRELTDCGYTILCTTHDPLKAREIFDEALLMRDGRLMECGPAPTVLTDEGIEMLYAS